MSLRLICYFILPLLSSVAVAQGQPSSYWRHNNSIVGLYADGEFRQFRYEQPRQGMLDEGVRKGTILFKGKKAGDAYRGTAYVFSQRCSATPYSVSGTLSADSQQIVLTGQAPANLNARCQPTTFRHETLQFDFAGQAGQPEVAREPNNVPSAPPAPPVAQPPVALPPVAQPPATRPGPLGQALVAHAQKEVCMPAIREGTKSETQQTVQRLERSLLGQCERCFDDTAKAHLSREDQAALDLVLSGATQSMSPDAVSEIRAKYEQLSQMCSEELTAKMTEELARK